MPSMCSSRRLAVALIFALLAGCGGGAEPAPAPARDEGILRGTVARAAGTFDLEVLALGGRLIGMDSGGWFYDGTYPVPGGFETPHFIHVFAVNASYGGDFDHVGYSLETAELTELVMSGETVYGSLATSGSPTTFELVHERELDGRDSALALVAGDWRFTNGLYQSSLVVAADGSTGTTSTYNGARFDCQSTGQASVIDAAYAIYGWQTTTSGSQCGGSQSYTGFAYLSDGSAPQDTLTVLLAGASQFLALRLVRQ